MVELAEQKAQSRRLLTIKETARGPYKLAGVRGMGVDRHDCLKATVSGRRFQRQSSKMRKWAASFT